MTRKSSILAYECKLNLHSYAAVAGDACFRGRDARFRTSGGLHFAGNFGEGRWPKGARTSDAWQRAVSETARAAGCKVAVALRGARPESGPPSRASPSPSLARLSLAWPRRAQTGVTSPASNARSYTRTWCRWAGGWPSAQEENGGEGGIRTPGGVAPTPHFECGAIDHSATSPRGRV